MVSEIRSLSADCLPSRIKASACGVSASQFFGEECRKFLQSNKDYSKKTFRITKFSLKTLQLISEIRSLSADCLPSLLA
ncbi:hypothetical protein [Peribacillus simplex]|uniref:hypothetical protein n=1 Tax=Peribacillus simplex TaxID=1478 RepID=UPI003D0035ED